MPLPPLIASPIRRRWAGIVFLVPVSLASFAACATASTPAGAGGPLPVVAAENVWGDLAATLGGDRVTVHTIIDSPAADPHDYEPGAADARAIASARILIDNGLGYDPWATKLAAANPVPGRIELTVGQIAGVGAGGNPHQWYSPTSVRAVVDAITETYQKLDPARASYFASRRDALLDTGLAPYLALIGTIKARYAGTPIGASESIVTPLAHALGLELVTPPTFLRAVSEGTDPTAQDKAAIDEQIAGRRIAVYVYNSQNATPDVRAQVAAATAAGIPVVTITETPTPADTSFQDWQTRQLTALEQALALARGTGGARP
ncbi:MAG: zinc ABC transporter substrate-binding protein [Actinobacteria bacterium]|nr:zinc ABC transporter substrate-binding protein [Actinomycetota bacterium]